MCLLNKSNSLHPFRVVGRPKSSPTPQPNKSGCVKSAGGKSSERRCGLTFCHSQNPNLYLSTCGRPCTRCAVRRSQCHCAKASSEHSPLSSALWWPQRGASNTVQLRKNDLCLRFIPRGTAQAPLCCTVTLLTQSSKPIWRQVLNVRAISFLICSGKWGGTAPR